MGVRLAHLEIRIVAVKSVQKAGLILEEMLTAALSVRLGTILAGSHVLHVKLADIPLQEPHPMKHYAKCAQQACTERDQE